MEHLLTRRVFISIQLKLLNESRRAIGENTRLSQDKLTPNEIEVLQEALNANLKTSNIRLREGEYQYSLVKTIASSQLESHFPDVRDIIRSLYGEEKTGDIQFIRKIQTILKKMEKSDILRILPKNKPWDLQRYGVSSFKFKDIDMNILTLATDEQLKQAQYMLRSLLIQQGASEARFGGNKAMIMMLIFAVGICYTASVWALMQPIINPIIFVIAFSIAVVCSLMLGKVLCRE
jgi:hypothetical protein